MLYKIIDMLPGKMSTGFYFEGKQAAQAPKAALVTIVVFVIIIVSAMGQFNKIGSIKLFQSYRMARTADVDGQDTRFHCFGDFEQIPLTLSFGQVENIGGG